MSQVVQRIMNLALAGAWQSWAASTRELARIQSEHERGVWVMEKTVARITNLALASALRQWVVWTHETINEIARNEALLTRFFVAFHKKVSAPPQGWMGWEPG